MENYDNLVEAIEGLKKQGYVEDFNLLPTQLECKSREQCFSPDEFVIDKFFRFEGMTDPDDQSILYAITASDAGLKGLLVNAYGVYADDTSSEMVERLNTPPLG